MTVVSCHTLHFNWRNWWNCFVIILERYWPRDRLGVREILKSFKSRRIKHSKFWISVFYLQNFLNDIQYQPWFVEDLSQFCQINLYQSFLELVVTFNKDYNHLRPCVATLKRPIQHKGGCKFHFCVNKIKNSIHFLNFLLILHKQSKTD